MVDESLPIVMLKTRVFALLGIKEAGLEWNPDVSLKRQLVNQGFARWVERASPSIDDLEQTTRPRKRAVAVQQDDASESVKNEEVD